MAERNGLISVNPANEDNRLMVQFASLDKNIIKPLEKWQFIKIEKIGKNRGIKMTELVRKTLKSVLGDLIYYRLVK